MSFTFHIRIVILFILLGSFNAFAFDDFTKDKLKAISVDSIESVIIPSNRTVEEYYKYAIIFEDLLLDSSSRDNQTKGLLLLMMLGDTLKTKIDNINFCYCNDVFRRIMEILDKQQIFIYQRPLSSVYKIFSLACDGGYSRIVNRFYLWDYFYHSIIVLLTSFIFLGWLFRPANKWRFKRPTKIVVMIIFGLLLLSIILFKISCKQNVSAHSFYGFCLN